GGRGGRNRRRHLPPACAHRRLAGALRRGPSFQGSLRRRPPQGHHRGRGTRHLAQRVPGQPRVHDGRGGLCQDVHRQGDRQRDASHRPGDGAGHAGLHGAHGLPGGFQARRRHPPGQRRPQLDDPHEGRTGRCLAHARPVPAGRQRPVDRHRAAAGAPRHRPLFGRPPAPDGLEAHGRDREQAPMRHPAESEARPMEIGRILETMEYGPAPESDGPVRQWLAQHKDGFGLFINGQWRKPSDAGTFATVNPATGETLATVVQARPEDVDDAVAAAREALPGWAALPGHVRARYLYALARQVQKHARFLAVLETLDNGKPIRETRDIDIPLVARHFYHHAGWAQLLETEVPGYEPVGVVGQIIPWNFPLLMLAWKIAPALAAGCTVVLKPAEYTPLTALYFAELCQEVGLPPGVVNIVTGDGAVGELIVRHPDVDKIAFTGSTEVGRLIRERTAGSGKALTLELGGKSPFIVFDDADLDSAVEGVVDAIWFNQGQVCCAGSRLLVQ